VHILLVEDNPGDVRLMRGHLEELGPERFDVTHVDRLDAGCACLIDGRFDVVLLDLSLPDCQGIDTLVRMHAAAKGVPVVVLTSIEDERLGVQLIQSGAQDYLVKGHVSSLLLQRALRYAIERKQTEQMLRRSEQELRYAFEERERLSQDLHDNLIQSLYAVGLGVEAAKPFVTTHPDAALVQLTQTVHQLNGAIREVREFITHLEHRSSTVLDLQWALNALIRSLSSARPDFLEVDIDQDIVGLVRNDHVAHFVNVAREALSNSLRHAHASRGALRFHRQEDSIRLEVSDNGVGFDAATLTHRGMGLGNMASRARKMGGELCIDSEPGRGTRVVLVLPTSA
jgi:signal transduction histidine kinase